MNQPTAKVAAPVRCPVCGQELPPDAPPSRCPHCLLRQGLPAVSSELQSKTVVAPRAPDSIRPLPQPGEVFGHYRVIRLLGQGGMGAVFEAEDLESGRRVALKVLGHQLDSPEARSRFFREGRLAASVNHPNSVYVFGTEDIAGIPVIAMELVAGGTLQERIARQGPMPVGEVVDCGLQIIAGLRSAQQVGVLHRDIKPSNCFLEADGSVKIGDFGLSISTFLRNEPDITATGAFLGTPAFSSPEQLRGDELTVRSDIYSVGVTLYFLLTGRHPFHAPDMVRLLATVLERRAESPAKWRPELPAGLCRAVLRCLDKDPEKRFRNYDELRAALLPFAPGAPTPATLGLRLSAYALDALLLSVPAGLLDLLVNFTLLGGIQPTGNRLAEALSRQLTPYDPRTLLLQIVCRTVVALTYFALLEGLWGASIGKRICRLRVARLDHTVPGVARALLRTVVITAAPTVVGLLGLNAAQAWASGPSFQSWITGFSLVILPTRLLLFVTAGRRNGFAGVHDLLSATRVTLRPAQQARPALPLAAEAAPELGTQPLIGPYHVLSQMGRQNGAELLLGFDARLLRRVWIRKLPPGTPAIPASLRRLSRPGRLRWLTARRTDAEAWDAYEAASGQALLTLVARPQEWSLVRYWLLDLGEELLVATQDGTLPAVLSLDRVWITADGRAKLLDFPAPGAADFEPERSSHADAPAATPQAFLRLVATSALQGRAVDGSNAELGPAVPLALHASRLLETLKAEADLKQGLAALRTLLNLAPRVSRRRRGLLLAGTLVFPLVAFAITWGMASLQRAILNTAPELATLRECLTHYTELQRQAKSGRPARDANLEAFEIYIAGQFAPLITDTARWNSPITQAVILNPLRTAAERILVRRGTPSAEQLAAASTSLERFFHKSPEAAAREALQQPNLFVAALAVGYGATVIFVILPSVVGSLLFRRGALIHLLGIVFVNRNGQLASRWRVAARNLIAWLPFLFLPITVETELALPLLAGLCVALATISALLPKRGLQDRLAGTWPVPR